VFFVYVLKMKKLLAISFILLLSSCVTDNQQLLNCETVIGSWGGNFGKVRLEISQDSIKLFYPRLRPENTPVMESVYSCTQKNDMLIIDCWAKYIFLNRGNKVIFSAYKGARGIENHYSDFTFIEKEGETIFKSVEDKQTPKDIFIVPEGYEGFCAIEFNNPNGVNAEINSAGNRIFEFDSSGLIQTKEHEDILNIVLKNIDFYYKEKTSGQLHNFEIVNKNDLPCLILDSSKTYVLNTGFNRIGRREINRKYAKNMTENIAIFKIGKPETFLIWSRDFE